MLKIAAATHELITVIVKVLLGMIFELKAAFKEIVNVIKTFIATCWYTWNRAQGFFDLIRLCSLNMFLIKNESQNASIMFSQHLKKEKLNELVFENLWLKGTQNILAAK